MNTNAKPWGPLDNAAMDVIDELKGGMSGRAFGKVCDIAHNRLATILRRDTPPPTLGEVERLAAPFDKSASWVTEEAERRLYGNGAAVTPLRPVSDPDGTMLDKPIAAQTRDVQSEHEGMEG